MIDTMIELPNNFQVTHIMRIGHDWQVNASDDEYCLFATGATITEALLNAAAKIAAEDYSGRKYDGSAPELEFNAQRSLAQRLGLVPKADPVIINRRT